MNPKHVIAAVAAVAVMAGSVPGRGAESGEARAVGQTPPRLSFTDGEVSFWRPGATDWTPAQVNTALAPGDMLYTSAGANLELQIGARAFVRAGAETHVGLENQEPDYVQFKITAGHASLDLRSLPPGRTIELDTPNAAFTIEHTGYYRVDIDSDTTTFITRRGGRATMTPAGGEASGITSSEQTVIEGTDPAQVATYVAPELDDWDRWNYDRTDHLIDAVSARYVSPGVCGAEALDHYGAWRVVPRYGPVWLPDSVAAGWAPYSTGRWMWDSYYGWTWVDDAPWGWAPYHYGRWVYVDGFWAWAPGPIAVTPMYAPALVAFFGGGGVAVHVGLGVPFVGWVALGWGEPLVPWWGPVGFVGMPWWGGWGGPRIVNNVIINETTVVNVRNITIYQNTDVHHAVVAVRREHFGRGPVEQARVSKVEVRRLEPVHGELPVKPTQASLVPGTGRAGQRPPETVLKKSVVGTRAPYNAGVALEAKGLKLSPVVSPPPSRIVPAPHRKHSELVSPRPPFGQKEAPERARPPLPPRFEAKPPRAEEPPPRVPKVMPRAEEPPLRVPKVMPRAEEPPLRVPKVMPRAEEPPPRVPKVMPRAEEPQAPMPKARPFAETPPLRVPKVMPRAEEPPLRVPKVMPRAEELRAPMPREAPRAPAPRVEAPARPPRELPGEPANRLFPGRPEGKSPRIESPPPGNRPEGGAAHELPPARGGGGGTPANKPRKQFGD